MRRQFEAIGAVLRRNGTFFLESRLSPAPFAAASKGMEFMNVVHLLFDSLKRSAQVVNVVHERSSNMLSRTSLLLILSLTAATQAAAGPSSQHSAQSTQHSAQSVQHSAQSAAAGSSGVAAAGLTVIAIPVLAVGTGLMVTSGALEGAHHSSHSHSRPAPGQKLQPAQESSR